MATTKISQFPTMSASDVDSANDVLPIVDTNLSSNKQITLNTLGSSITASHAVTASYALNSISTSTGSLLVTGSVSLNTITFTKGDGTTFPITVNTGSGGGGVSYWGLDTGTTYFGTPTITSSRNVVIPEADFLVNGGTISGSTFTVDNGILRLQNNSVLRFSTSGNSILKQGTSGIFRFDKGSEITGSVTASVDVVAGSTLRGNFLNTVGAATIGGTLTADDTTVKDLTTSGSFTRKVREITLTVNNSTGGGGMPSIQADDDIILIVGNTTGALGVNDYTLNCSNLFYGDQIGRTVTIINASTAVGSDLILGSPTPGGNYTANSFTGTGKFGSVCGTTYQQITILIKANDHVIIYGTGI